MSDINEDVGARGRGSLRRAITAGVGVGVLALALASPATAAQPNRPSCLGHDIRTYADMGAGFGTFVSGIATNGGAGDEIQLHLAGTIPDTVLENSCNNG